MNAYKRFLRKNNLTEDERIQIKELLKDNRTLFFALQAILIKRGQGEH